MTRWRKPHFCPLDSTCRSVGAPPRLYLFMFGYVITIALAPSARIITLGRDRSKWTVKEAKWVTVKKGN